MCEPPPRQWREFFSPTRILLGAGAFVLFAAGMLIRNHTMGLTLIGVGAFLLLAAFVAPAVTQVEFGLPLTMKVTGAVRDRAEQLRKKYEEQRADFELCAKLLCDDPATANELLTGAMARSASDWRGPVSSNVRLYVLCWFVHHLVAHQRLAGVQQPTTVTHPNPLSVLTPIQRIVVVLSEMADVPIDEIAPMVGLSPADAQAELSRGEKALADAGGRRGGVR